MLFFCFSGKLLILFWITEEASHKIKETNFMYCFMLLVCYHPKGLVCPVRHFLLPDVWAPIPCMGILCLTGILRV